MGRPQAPLAAEPRVVGAETVRFDRESSGVPVVEVRELRKAYGPIVAVDGISFSVAENEVFGLVGPNGAGKTTTIECLEGLRNRDAGDVSVLGLDPGDAGADLRRRIGVQLQESSLFDRIRVQEALDLFASFYPQSIDWRPLSRPAWD